MRTSRNKILTIVLIVIAVIVMVSGIFTYLYFCTDMLWSGQELFVKYLTQNLEELNKVSNLQKVNKIEDKLKQSKYEENITISYTESEENNEIFQLTIDTQNDPLNKKNYGIIGLLIGEMEEALELEYMIENDTYSLRFTEAIKQFLTVKNTNLRQLAIKLGMEEESAEQIPDTLDFEKFSFEKINFTEEEKNTEISKYASLVYNNIQKEKYVKNKNAVITVNGKTITTNAYTLTLNMQDMENIGIALLEALKQDEIILSKLEALDEMLQDYTEESIKDTFVETLQESIDEKKTEEITEEITEEKNIVFTVYEEKGKTVRLKVEQNLDAITLDTIEVDGKKQIDINYKGMDEENVQVLGKITYVKESDNKLNIEIMYGEGEEQQTSEFVIELIENENNTKINIVQNDTNGQMIFTRDIKIVDEINYKVTLDNSNNLVLNNLLSEQIEYVFTALGEKLKTEYVEPLQTELITIFMGTMGGNIEDTEDSITTYEQPIIE